MLSLARLEDVSIVKQFSRAQILGFFAKLCLKQEFMRHRYPHSPLHHSIWPGSQACSRRLLGAVPDPGMHRGLQEQDASSRASETF